MYQSIPNLHIVTVEGSPLNHPFSSFFWNVLKCSEFCVLIKRNSNLPWAELFRVAPSSCKFWDEMILLITKIFQHFSNPVKNWSNYYNYWSNRLIMKGCLGKFEKQIGHPRVSKELTLRIQFWWLVRLPLSNLFGSLTRSSQGSIKYEDL